MKKQNLVNIENGIISALIVLVVVVAVGAFSLSVSGVNSSLPVFANAVPTFAEIFWLFVGCMMIYAGGAFLIWAAWKITGENIKYTKII